MEYFVQRFPHIFPTMDMERLNKKFLNFQLLPAKDIPSSVKKSANLTDEDPHCTEILWGYLRNAKEPGTNDLAFGQLLRVAEVILTIPHSNAGKQFFFLIKK